MSRIVVVDSVIVTDVIGVLLLVVDALAGSVTLLTELSGSVSLSRQNGAE